MNSPTESAVQLQINTGHSIDIHVINNFDEDGYFAGYTLCPTLGLPQPQGVFWVRTDIHDWLHGLGIPAYDLIQECDDDGIPLVQY